MRNWGFKNEFTAHLLSTALLFSLIVLARFSVTPELILFLSLGAFVGMILPDVDHLIYALFLKPYDLSSQRIRLMLSEKRFSAMFSLLYDSRSERRSFVFHSYLFVILFEIFGFWVLSSSRGIFGRALVISFLLHLLIDQIVDLKIMGNVDRWIKAVGIAGNVGSIKIAITLQIIILLLFGFFM